MSAPLNQPRADVEEWAARLRGAQRTSVQVADIVGLGHDELLEGIDGAPGVTYEPFGRFDPITAGARVWFQTCW